MGSAHELHYGCEQEEIKGNSTHPSSLHICLTQLPQAKTTINTNQAMLSWEIGQESNPAGKLTNDKPKKPLSIHSNSY